MSIHSLDHPTGQRDASDFLTPLIGRASEIEALLDLLIQRRARIVDSTSG